MKSSKRYISVFGMVFGAGVTAAGALVALTDPFFHYHMPWFGLKPVVNNEIYQNPGLAEHASYDSVIIGSSMTENFDTVWFDEAYGIRTLKLSYAGATAENLRIAVECAGNAKGQELRYVFGCLDTEILTANAHETAYPLPEYLYDDVWYNDVYYLLNKDVIFQDVWEALKENAEGTVVPLNEAYSWFESQKDGFSKENVVRLLELPEVFSEVEQGGPEVFPEVEQDGPGMFSEVEQDEPVILDETVRSVQKIKEFVRKYPQTEFRFFYSPYSMAYWYNRYAAGAFLTDVKNLEYSMKELLDCENLELFFPSGYEMITDLDSYKDLGHYDMEIQYQIFEEMRDGENLLTEENYQNYMEEFRGMVMECDFESVFSLSGMSFDGERACYYFGITI